jgi:hypothetical protein
MQVQRTVLVRHQQYKTLNEMTNLHNQLPVALV